MHRRLCEYCRNNPFSFDALQSRREWVPPWEQVQQLKDTCNWCSFVYRLVREAQKAFEKQWGDSKADPAQNLSVYLQRVDDYQDVDQFPQSLRVKITVAIFVDSSTGTRRFGSELLVYTEDNDHAARFITGHDILREIDQTSTYTQVLKCVENCSKHERCQHPKPANLPTRLLDCTDPSQPRLFISTGTEKEYYAALSYVWGEEQPNMTTSNNLEAYVKAIDLQLIPRTIRDAITVTHKLGLRFLWVDSFCIIQDSKEDKRREIPNMRRIYHNAYVTIVAACARRVSAGFLHIRDVYPRPESRATVPFLCPDGIMGTITLCTDGNAPDEATYERAWCVEERVLSPRSLVYCTHTLQYRCQTVHINVDGTPHFVSPRPFGSGTNSAEYRPFAGEVNRRLSDFVFAADARVVQGDLEESEMWRSWRGVLADYTRCYLTSPKDRLVAIAGVAEQFDRCWPTGGYKAGLWLYQLPRCLLWKTVRSAPRPEMYRAPSWSWAAVDGEIDVDPDGHGVKSSNRSYVCTVESCQVVSVDMSHPYGEVRGGSLTIRAIVRTVIWDWDLIGRFELQEEEPLRFVVPCASMTEDSVGDLSKDTLNKAVVAVLQDKPSVRGLVLVPDTTDNHCGSTVRTVYRRVGEFKAWPGCREKWVAAPQQLVTIV
ncbi:hypothetical protein E1B28_012691 [Marasmius oreades]|uniref:Heterokaryon incompatibility domain-containing protein n=1 Tax=Marasmius oreades TaxID=181124 RepID=A0A9P7RTD8_9AGAR|nr:uncharacterized protein E1B28_012691 [Marasmius oreades]KAG7088723.1 hypothetical protein E1B28_012691 [Marasmius oreades]